MGKERTGAWEIANGLGLQVALVERVLLRAPRKFPGAISMTKLRIQMFWRPRDWCFQISAWRHRGVINIRPIQILRRFR